MIAMIELIGSLIFIGSLAGAAAIFARKMPQAMKMAPISDKIKSAGGFLASLKNSLAQRLKSNPRFKDFNWIDFAHKTLLKGRVAVLKIDNKINDYIAKLKQKSEEKQTKDAAMLDNYWHDIKNIVKTKKPQKNLVKTEGSDEAAAEAFSRKPVLVSEIETAPKTEENKLISRVVFPQQAKDGQNQSHGKKKRANRAKSYRDPFRW